MTRRPIRFNLNITLISAATLDAAKRRIISLIETGLKEAGQEDLLRQNKFRIEIPKPLPSEFAKAVHIGLHFASEIPLELVNECMKYILAGLGEFYSVHVKPVFLDESGSLEKSETLQDPEAPEKPGSSE